MNFCSSCGHPVELRTPPGDTRRRFVWGICYTIPIPIVISIVAETLSLAAVGAAGRAVYMNVAATLREA